jgi:hypothetical protein
VTELAAAIAGGLAGVISARIWDYVAYLRESKRALYLAALASRDRLEKILHAVDALPEEMRDRAARDGWRTVIDQLDSDDWRRKTIQNELSHLGGSLDDYLAAMAPIRSHGERATHLRLHGRMTNILITHELAPAGRIIADVDREVERVGWIARGRPGETAS